MWCVKIILINCFRVLKFTKIIKFMSLESIIALSVTGVLSALIIFIIVWKAVFIVKQGTVAIITRFGKFRKISVEGLNFKVPFMDTINTWISMQNRSAELKFQAVTSDQASVYFNAMLLYSVANATNEVIKNVAFKFRSENELNTALTRTIEGSVRAFVATKKQSEILQIRNEIVAHVKNEIDTQLLEWGYHLQDLQMNDISFASSIMSSMESIVASNNLKLAAENEGQALLITKTKAAEADGNAIKISAEAEKEAARLRGEGIALFRQQVAKGMAEASKEMNEAGLDSSLILFSMWTDAIKEFADKGKGNVIFLDGSNEGMQKTMKQMMAMSQFDDDIVKKDKKLLIDSAKPGKK